MEFNFTEKWIVEFIKAQDEFVITQCIKHLQKDEEIRIFKISEDKLKEIFMLGLADYQMNNLKDRTHNHMPHID